MSNAPLQGSALSELFQQLSSVLQRYRQYWQFSPMDCLTLPFSPALNAQLSQLGASELAVLDQDPQQQRHYFAEYFPELMTLPLWLTASKTADNSPWPFWLTNGIHGRKLAQIQQFCQFIPEQALPVLEWCAGKGHLGRLFAAQSSRAVTSIEWQPSLCEAGSALASQHKIPQQFIQADVLTTAGAAAVHAEQQVLALHACGELHLQLLAVAVAKGCQQLQVAPCCYHLISSSDYQPLSKQAQADALALSRQDLKLAVQGQVTAGERVSRLRQTEVTWRLAYDEWRAQLTGQRAYQPLPSLPKQWFSGDFAAFAKMAASLQHLIAPAVTDWPSYLAAGEARYLLVQRLDIVRHLFRRPLELYLVLDRALYLQQHGYQVSVQAFCDYQLTPRNLLLQASLNPAV
ncbi:methyltransferase [Alishewanella sp. HL-SH05]|uniref:methyltransferase n=1 Tax=Alishewanella sp. HL-SH05 TaxID=3461145 RepID=UPI0040411936